MSFETKLQYFLISFALPNGHASVRMGWLGKYIDASRLEEARQALGLDDRAVPLAVSHLGEMTPSQFRGDPPPQRSDW